MARQGKAIGARGAFFAWFAVVMLVVSATAFAGWRMADAAQDVLLSQVGASLAATMKPLRLNVDRSDGLPQIESIAADAVEIERQKLIVATTRSVAQVIEAFSLLLACAWVAYASRNFVLTLLMALWGWACSAWVSALLVSESYRLLVELRDAFTPAGVTWLGRGVPFGLLFVTGLIGALPWNGALPLLLGWCAGWCLQEWRSASLPFGARAEGANVVGRQTCACGTLNLENAIECYACGATLGCVTSGESGAIVSAGALGAGESN